ncbi:hypothetical protein BDZ97DRAFT_1916025 [Flammula alnicola]|nr:hypothetical protein BDZ97DRAFT_1916025 [Flammula alnicola]
MSRRHLVSPNAPATQPMVVAASRNSSPAPAGGIYGHLARNSESPDSTHTSSEGFMAPSMANPQMIYHMDLLPEPYSIQQAYLEGQQKISALQSEISDLKAQLADTQLKFVGKGSRKRGPAGQGDHDSASTVIEEIRKLGCHFQLFYTPFQVDPSAFTAARPAFDVNDPIRYADTQNQALGITTELYEAIPIKFHSIMSLNSIHVEVGNFSKNFRNAMGSSRSSSLMSLHREAASIFGVPAKYFTESDTAPGPPVRDTIPEIQSLLGSIVNPNGPADYPRFPPILCFDGDTTKVNKRFLNESLLMVARAVIFGKTAAQNKARAVARSTSAYLRSDIPATTTFGLIAWSRYILSKDEHFENGGIGPQTQINYLGDFEYYKCWLIEASHNPVSASWVEQLLARWDAEIFSTHNKHKGHFPASVNETEVIELDDAAEIERDLNMLHLTTPADDWQLPGSGPNVTESNDDFYVIDAPPAPMAPDPMPDSEPPRNHINVIPSVQESLMPIIPAHIDFPQGTAQTINAPRPDVPFIDNVETTLITAATMAPPLATVTAARSRPTRSTIRSNVAVANLPSSELDAILPVQSSFNTVNDHPAPVRGRGRGRSKKRGRGAAV